MTAQVTITVNTAKGVLTLPASALGSASRKGNYRVGIYDQATGQVQPTEVKVGLNNNITAEIVSGLKEDDLVVAPRSAVSPATDNGNTGRRFGGGPVLFGGPTGGGGGRGRGG